MGFEKRIWLHSRNRRVHLYLDDRQGQGAPQGQGNRRPLKPLSTGTGYLKGNWFGSPNPFQTKFVKELQVLSTLKPVFGADLVQWSATFNNLFPC